MSVLFILSRYLYLSQVRWC